MKIIFTIIALSLSTMLISQTSSDNQVIKKEHFIIENVTDSDQIKLVNALSDFDLEPYRLIDKRRTISFTSGESLILFSANELKTKYGKNVRQRNILVEKHDIQLEFIESKGIILHKTKIQN